LGDVFGGRPLCTLHDVELHPVTLGEAAEALRLDGGVVDKAVLVPILRSDETKAFCVVEPFHRAEGASHLLLHVDLTASVPGDPDSRVFMSAGQSCVIKNERPVARSPGSRFPIQWVCCSCRCQIATTNLQMDRVSSRGGPQSQRAYDLAQSATGSSGPVSDSRSDMGRSPAARFNACRNSAAEGYRDSTSELSARSRTFSRASGTSSRRPTAVGS